MSQSFKFNLYSKLPVALQNCACSLAGIKMRRERYNKVFKQFLEFLDKAQWWSLEDQKEHQNEQLRAMIKHAYDTVPYYREVFDHLKLVPNDIKKSEDLLKLPILDKQTVRQRFEDLISRDWPKKRTLQGYTGGTTGTALKLLYDTTTTPKQWAVWWRHRQRFGIKFGEPFIVFAGRDIVPLSDMKPPFWRRNYAIRQTYVSIHHMLEQNMQALVDYLQTRRVGYYSGYPSGLYLLAKYLLENKIELKNPPRITVTGAESVLPHQRRVIELAFHCELADQYGASEMCGNMSECEKHLYHIDMEFGVVELLPMPDCAPDLRQIICTGLCNPAMPLIRYNIGDVATIANHGECSCGRKSPMVSKIDGRIESYIITPDGRQLGRLDFLFKKSKNILEAQLIQESIDRVLVKIVQTAEFSTKDETTLIDLMRQYLGDVIMIKFEYVNEIPREANGKFRQIISKTFRDQYSDIKV